MLLSHSDPKLVGKVIHLDSSKFDETVSEGKPVLVDFWADWCAPCHAMAPVFENLSEKYGDKVIFARVDVEQNQDIAQSYGIEAIPTFILFLKGEPRERAVGAVGKSGLEELLKKVP